MKLWYAVVTDNDADWGYGSEDKETARQMAEKLAKTGNYETVDLVTIDDGDDPIAIEVERI